MAFFTITLAAGMSAAEHRRAALAGPPAVASVHDSRALLTRAGFEQISETDVTENYLCTTHAWADARDRYRDELEAAGREVFAQQQRDKRLAVAAIEAGWLNRTLVTAVRQGSCPQDR